MAIFLQLLIGSGWAKAHLTAPNWDQPTLGVRFVTSTILMHPLNSYSSTEVFKSSSCWCTITSTLSSFFYILNENFHEEGFCLTQALAGKVSMPLTLIALGPRVDLSWFTNRSPLRGGRLGTRRTCWFDARGARDKFARSRKRSAKTWLASSGGLRVILKISSVKIRSSRLI